MVLNAVMTMAWDHGKKISNRLGSYACAVLAGTAHAQTSGWAASAQFTTEPGQAEHAQSNDWVAHSQFALGFGLGTAGLLPLVWGLDPSRPSCSPALGHGLEVEDPF